MTEFPDLNEELLQILAMLPLTEGFLVFLRVGAVFSLLPIFGSPSVPARMRLLVALLVSICILPMVSTLDYSDVSRAEFIKACAGEFFAGFLLGFLARSVFWSIQIAGAMAAQAISLSQILGNSVEQPQPAIGQFLYVASLALASLLNFHVIILKALIQSYDLVPLGHLLSPGTALQIGVDTAAHVFRLGFGLAGPFLIVAVIYNLCLGVVNRAMPALMVAFVGAPAITWLGLALLMLTAPLMLMAWKQELIGFTLPGTFR